VAVIAPAPMNALVGIGSTLFALGLTLAYNTYAPTPAADPAEPLSKTLAATLRTAVPPPIQNGAGERDQARPADPKC